MRKLDKVLSIVMIVLMIACISTSVFALNTSVLEQVKGDAELGNATNTIGSIGNTIFTIITRVGMILAVIIVAILGIKYMMGSSEEKSEYKKSMIPYLVGAVLVFGASAIGSAVVGFGTSIIK